MKRYQKANEGIHAPEELRENAVRPSQKRSHARWMGAVAAVLAVAIIGGIALWPGRTGGPAVLSSDNPGLPIGRGAERPETYSAHALSLAAWPEMRPYPQYEDYYSGLGDDDDARRKADDAYSEAWDAWWEDRQALRSDTDYTGLMDGFLSRSTAQFLTGAGEDNRVYSPLNVYMALSMLAEITDGNSRQQILDLLQVESIEVLRERAFDLWRDNYQDDGSTASLLANSLWLRDGMTYSQETLDRLAADYYASSFSGEMGSEEYDQALRDWLNEQTRGLLAEQAGGLSMDPDTVLALASTIYFKAAWSTPFNPDNNTQGVFHSPSGDVKTEYLHYGEWFDTRYYWGEHFSAIGLGFQAGGYHMWLILPDEGYTVDDLVAGGEAMEFLFSDKYGKWDEQKGEYVGAWPNQESLRVNLSLPKFDVSDHLDLIEGLKALGVTDVFDYHVSNFDPLGASTSDPLYVSQAQHTARVTIDEEGCTAASYVELMMGPGADMPPDEEVDFTLDRPFLFAITGSGDLPLFLGVVNQPNG
ncbi:MAG: serpin family protein [Clostridiales bacterium]|nr:serpin family protein [Clostridiales bacterium]